MITSIAPISEALVVVGRSDSSLQVSRFPSHQSSNSSKESEYLIGPSPASPLHNSNIGKCSRFPVSDVSYSEGSIAAASSATLSTWDLVRGDRLRHWATPDHSTTCHYITPNLLAVAGHGCTMNVYDIRSMSLKPIWSLPLSRDNLFTMCGADTTIFAGGADGQLHEVDLRESRKSSYNFFPESTNLPAVLGLSYANENVVALFETGELLSLKHETSDKEAVDITFKTNLATTYSTHIDCDALSYSNEIHVAIGSEEGCVNYLSHGNGNTSKIDRIELGSGPCTKVKWGISGLYVGSGDQIFQLPFVHDRI